MGANCCGCTDRRADDISDSTKIGGRPWKDIKKYAMPDDYYKKRWYAKLDDRERELLELCRKAQRE